MKASVEMLGTKKILWIFFGLAGTVGAAVANLTGDETGPGVFMGLWLVITAFYILTKVPWGKIWNFVKYPLGIGLAVLLITILAATIYFNIYTPPSTTGLPVWQRVCATMNVDPCPAYPSDIGAIEQFLTTYVPDSGMKEELVGKMKSAVQHQSLADFQTAYDKAVLAAATEKMQEADAQVQLANEKYLRAETAMQWDPNATWIIIASIVLFAMIASQLKNKIIGFGTITGTTLFALSIGGVLILVWLPQYAWGEAGGLMTTGLAIRAGETFLSVLGIAITMATRGIKLKGAGKILFALTTAAISAVVGLTLDNIFQLSILLNAVKNTAGGVNLTNAYIFYTLGGIAGAGLTAIASTAVLQLRMIPIIADYDDAEKANVPASIPRIF